MLEKTLKVLTVLCIAGMVYGAILMSVGNHADINLVFVGRVCQANHDLALASRGAIINLFLLLPMLTFGFMLMVLENPRRC